jgi:D-sedoheptulose 7-phosphate isomerase
MVDLKKKIAASAEEAVQAAKLLTSKEALHFIEQAVEMTADCLSQGGKLLLAGNGGSLCDAAHFAQEMTGVFRKPRKALPAIVINEPSHLTCTGNDLGFEWVFARGVEAFGNPGDLFIGLTTSGNSKNLLLAFEAAKERGLRTIAFLGKQGGQLAGFADCEWIVNGFKYSDRIQEAHMAAIHIIIEAVEYRLFPELISQPEKTVKALAP